MKGIESRFAVGDKLSILGLSTLRSDRNVNIFNAYKRGRTSIRRVIDPHWSVRTEFHNHWTTDALKSSFSASSSTTCLGLRVIIGGSFHFPFPWIRSHKKHRPPDLRSSRILAA